jgi:hypothetical protein
MGTTNLKGNAEFLSLGGKIIQFSAIYHLLLPWMCVIHPLVKEGYILIISLLIFFDFEN